METKEVKIVPPEGYEVDKENSTYNCIKFKPLIVKRWRDNMRAQFDGYYITSNADIINTHNMYNIENAYNVFATKKQAKSALAMARISQIMANDERFGGIVTDEEWNNRNITKYCIMRFCDAIKRDVYYYVYCFLAFHTEKQRELFLEENEDLVKDYLML